MKFEDMTPLQRRLHNAAIVIEGDGDEHGFAGLLREVIAIATPEQSSAVVKQSLTTERAELIAKLREGYVYLPKRWSGDTHSESNTGDVDVVATEALMAKAADMLEADAWRDNDMTIAYMSGFADGKKAVAAGAQQVPQGWADAVNLARNIEDLPQAKPPTRKGVMLMVNAILSLDAILLGEPQPPQGEVK